MSVDRELRDKLAHLLAAYLRGGDGLVLRRELMSLGRQVGEAHDGFPPSRESFPETDDEAAKDAWEVLWMHLRPGRSTWTATEWDSDCRWLAFLNSDTASAAELKLDLVEDIGPREIRAARWHLVWVAAAIAVSFQVGVWLYLAAAAASQLAFTISMSIRERRRQSRQWSESVWPFASPEDWAAQRHWLQELHIPPYDRATHAAPLRQQILTGLMMYAVTGCFLLFTLTMAPLWPLWLLIMACKRIRTESRCPSVAQTNGDA